MIFVMDANFLIQLLCPERASAPPDPESGGVVANFPERLDNWVEGLDPEKDQILVPAPAFAELLVCNSGAFPDLLSSFQNNQRLKLAPFDELCAVETGLLTYHHRTRCEPDYRPGSKESRSKVKFDRQILATALVNHAERLCTWDDRLAKRAERHGVSVVWPHELPRLPQEQYPLELPG